MSNSSVSDVGGAATWIGGVALWVVDKLEIISINDTLTLVSVSIGIVWMIFKIRNEIITYKINRKKLTDEK